jgi:WD40 repeat protein/tRNA A-37 threonylcarbamoyl transferase component Bud32
MIEQLNRAGRQLGNYYLVCLLGKGHSAEIYLGEHIHQKTYAAIKVFSTRLNDSDIEKFRAEAYIISQLIHPHIARILDFGAEDGTPFLAMDYISGGAVRNHVPRGTTLPIETIVSYMTQLAQALQYAHNVNVLHRDIRPENILLNQQGNVFLSDFALTSVAQHSHGEDTQENAGRAAYTAPEQTQGKFFPASDQYSLGIVVYEWLSGYPPFHGSSQEVYAQHQSAFPPLLRQKIPTISPTLEEAVLRALAKDPRQRFDSVQSFATALRLAADEQLFHTVVQGPPQLTPVAASSNQAIDKKSDSQAAQPASRPSRRKVLITGLVGLAVIAGMGGETWLTIAQNASSKGTTVLTYRGHSMAVSAVAWSPDGKLIASGSGDNTVQIWDATNGNTLLTYQGHTDYVYDVAWSPDGKLIASCGNDGTVQIWDASDGRHILTYPGDPTMYVSAVAWSPDGRFIASGSEDNTVKIWDAATGHTILTYNEHTDSVNTVKWSPDGKYIASGGDDDTVQIWGPTDGKTVTTYAGHNDTVNAVAWSPDSMHIASGSDDTTVQVWGATSSNLIFTYRGHSDAVYAVAWSPNGKRIVSGSADTTVRVWNATDGSKAFIYHGHSASVNAVAWSPDGKRIASGSGGDSNDSNGNVVEVWQAPQT